MWVSLRLSSGDIVLCWLSVKRDCMLRVEIYVHETEAPWRAKSQSVRSTQAHDTFLGVVICDDSVLKDAVADEEWWLAVMRI
jgi:hypothetical protein